MKNLNKRTYWSLKRLAIENQNIVHFVVERKPIMDMKKGAKNREKPTKGRDFHKEYEQIIKRLGYKMDSIDFELGENSGHIKKYSIYKDTPTPVLTDFTFSTQP